MSDLPSPPLLSFISVSLHTAHLSRTCAPHKYSISLPAPRLLFAKITPIFGLKCGKEEGGKRSAAAGCSGEGRGRTAPLASD
jgi:hypothetical protein